MAKEQSIKLPGWPVPTVPCPRCDGSGRVELTGIHAETLGLLRGLGREATGAELARLDGCKATAMNNRLSYLERLGLAGSRRHGRARLFRALTAPDRPGETADRLASGRRKKVH